MGNSSITMRPYGGESDLQALVDLFDACEQVDQLESSTSIAQLRRSLEAPSIDRERGLMLWEDDQEQLIGFGYVLIEEPTSENPADGELGFVVHPIARGGDLEQKIIDWAENRMEEVGKERQGQPKLFTWSRHSRADRIATLNQHGFGESRHFWFLSRPLTEAIPKPQLPEGFIVRAVNAEQEAQVWVDLHNQSFDGSWNYHPLTVENYKHHLQNPDYLPELDLVAVDAEGKFASICYCSINKAHNTFIGRQEGWAVLLFTSREFQRRGLARAMLFHSLHRLKALNIDIAKIGVDSENAFGARKLYESVGFKHLYTNIAYVKHL
jgi:mycothiol synthase